MVNTQWPRDLYISAACFQLGKGSKYRFLQRAVLGLYGKDFAQSTLEQDNRKRLRIPISRSFFPCNDEVFWCAWMKCLDYTQGNALTEYVSVCE